MPTLKMLTHDRRRFLSENAEHDYTIISEPSSKVVLSVPHAVEQVRLGKHKGREIGSITTALYLQKASHCSLIAKTKNNNDDANFDEFSPYKDALEEYIRRNDIEFLIDIHSLSSKRDMDINLGLHLGYNIKDYEGVFDYLHKELLKNKFTVSIDAPFMASGNTVCNSMKKKFDNLFALQIEINSKITKQEANFDRHCLLISIMEKWIKLIDKTFQKKVKKNKKIC